MTITTTSSSASLSSHGPDRTFIFYALWLALPGFVLLGIGKQNRKHVSPAASLLGLFLLALLLSSCGGGGSNGRRSGGQLQRTQPGTYEITVTGTSGTLGHQAPSTATLIVNP
jgi:hypothetical protein